MLDSHSYQGPFGKKWKNCSQNYCWTPSLEVVKGVQGFPGTLVGKHCTKVSLSMSILKQRIYATWLDDMMTKRLTIFLFVHAFEVDNKTGLGPERSFLGTF